MCGVYDDFGAVIPRVLAKAALRYFARLNDALLLVLLGLISGASSFLGFLVPTVSFRGDGGDVIAISSLQKKKSRSPSTWRGSWMRKERHH